MGRGALKCPSEVTQLGAGQFLLRLTFFFYFLNSANKVPDEVEMESDSEDDESDKEAEVAEAHQQVPQSTESLEDMASKLSKAQEKELRRIRKLDYSWASIL